MPKPLSWFPKVRFGTNHPENSIVSTQQNAMSTPSAFHLCDLFWAEQETLIGKVVDFEYLAGVTKGRMDIRFH